MGFPTGYAESLLPKLLLHTLTLLGLIRTLILTLLGLLGLSDFLEPEPIWPDPPTTARPGPASVSASLIQEMLPVVKFSEVEGAEEEEMCAVCLSDIEGEEEIRQLRNCRHMFHRACVDRWMDHEQSTCPLCRSSFIPEELLEAFNERLWADVYGGEPECLPTNTFL